MLLRLDGDTFEATLDVLRAMYAKVADGGWIIIDDYHLHGCRQAVRQFRREHGIVAPIFPVPEDYVWACNQHDPRPGLGYRTSPQKRPQGAYWRKGGRGAVPPAV